MGVLGHALIPMVTALVAVGSKQYDDADRIIKAIYVSSYIKF